MKIATALKNVEAKLASLLGTSSGVPLPVPVAAPKALSEITEKDLLNGLQLKKNAKTQDEIDALFESS